MEVFFYVYAETYYDQAYLETTASLLQSHLAVDTNLLHSEKIYMTGMWKMSL